MAMYKKINQTIERYSEIVAISWIVVIIPLVIVPVVIHSFFMYFTTDLGTEAFELPAVIW